MRSPLREVQNLKALVNGGENDRVEFKSSFSYNKHIKRDDERLELAVLKVIGGFMNVDGETLLIGITDGGAVCGIEDDLELLGDLETKSRNQLRDRFKRRISQRMKNAGFKEVHLKLMKMRFVNTEDHDVCLVEVTRSPIPVHLTIGKTKCLPVRLDGQTKCYDLEEALDFMKTYRPDFLE